MKPPSIGRIVIVLGGESWSNDPPSPAIVTSVNDSGRDAENEFLSVNVRVFVDGNESRNEFGVRLLDTEEKAVALLKRLESHPGESPNYVAFLPPRED